MSLLVDREGGDSRYGIADHGAEKVFMGYAVGRKDQWT
jgi:hypothetical protein